MTWTRPQLVALTVDTAKAHGLVPWEFLGGMLAEGFDPAASRPVEQKDWRRYWEGVTPDTRFDVSFGLGQKNVRYSEPYAEWCRSVGLDPSSEQADQYPGDEVIAGVKTKFLDPAYALEVAAKGYHYWRYDPEVEPLKAWVAYNGPVYYRGWTRLDGTKVTWQDSPNLENYRRGLAEARRLLGESETVTFNPNTRLILQNDDWSCFITSVRMALEAYGRTPSEQWAESQVLKDNVESEALGLLDASARPAAAWVTTQYSNPAEGTPALVAEAIPQVTFSRLAELAGTTGLVAGGRRFGSGGHWVFIRGFDRARDVLLLGNPAPGYNGVDQELSEDQFNARGPWSAMTISPLVAEPTPGPDISEVDHLKGTVSALNNLVGNAYAPDGVVRTALQALIDGPERSLGEVRAELRSVVRFLDDNYPR